MKASWVLHGRCKYVGHSAKHLCTHLKPNHHLSACEESLCLILVQKPQQLSPVLDGGTNHASSDRTRGDEANETPVDNARAVKDGSRVGAPDGPPVLSQNTFGPIIIERRCVLLLSPVICTDCRLLVSLQNRSRSVRRCTGEPLEAAWCPRCLRRPGLPTHARATRCPRRTLPKTVAQSVDTCVAP